MLPWISWKIKLREFHIDQKYFENTLSNKSENPESFKNNHSGWKAIKLMCFQLVRIWWGHFASCFICNFVFQAISEKNYVTKILHVVWGSFLYENNWNFNFYGFSYKLIFIRFLFFRMTQKQKPIFYGVEGLATKKKFLIVSRTLLVRHPEFNRLIQRNFLMLFLFVYSFMLVDDKNSRLPLIDGSPWVFLEIFFLNKFKNFKYN